MFFCYNKFAKKVGNGYGTAAAGQFAAYPVSDDSIGAGAETLGHFDAPGIKSLTALCVDVVIPFNILKSCLAPWEMMSWPRREKSLAGF